MTDDRFDRFLASAVAPEERLPDRAFVAKVQLAVSLDAQLAATRTMLFGRIVEQVIALAAVALAAIVVARSPFMSDLLSQDPAVTLAGVVIAFTFLLFMIARPADQSSLAVS